MTKDEALRLALEVLQDLEDTQSYWWQEVDEVTLKQMEPAITAIKAALEAKDEPHKWKLVPIEPTDEMLKAMDECSIEGYDERLYAGYAASVYMAAIDVAPSPSQQHAEDIAKLGWQYFECPACGSEGARAFPKQEAKYEPVAWMYGCVGKGRMYAEELDDPAGWQPLYTTPPQRTWVGLTDEEFEQLLVDAKFTRSDLLMIGACVEDICNMVEAKLKEKNT